ncbi:DMT family transporter [Candidatus Symbiopectobacterium sp. NZEC135]|uniref:DMT family transporter n=1 Tax=Candidatus Symbiopectobacterium sp. NZEC135 TaxID=2820471 RepID=UPI00222632B4|nr:DMT family transporter [Candidatus Symbiopectobacterium sp. NZEC135]MCW2481866.1 DMT family transporter [Candidatus Symbiopectobacterium sp. NZEC135]
MKNTTAFFTNEKIVFALATLCCLLWGSAYPAIKNGYALFLIEEGDIASKLVFAGYRFVLAGGLLLLLAMASGKAIARFKPGQLRQLAVLGITQTTLQYIFFYIGLAYTTGVKGSIMNATSTFFSVLLAHCLYANDKITPNKAIGCLLGFLGVTVVNVKGLDDFSFTLMGDGFVVIAAFVLSAATIYGKRISQTMDPIIMTGYQLAVGGIILTLTGYLSGGSLSVHGWNSVLILFYLVLLSSITFALWSQLLKYNKVGTVAPFNFLIPIAGAVLSALFLDESILEWRYAAALVLVCLGIGLVNRSPQTK